MRKDFIVKILLNILWPGLGTLYSGRNYAGFLLSTLFFVSVYFYLQTITKLPHFFIKGLLVLKIIYILLLIISIKELKRENKSSIYHKNIAYFYLVFYIIIVFIQIKNITKKIGFIKISDFNEFPILRESEIVLYLKKILPIRFIPVLYEKNNKIYTGRIIGIPGDKIEIKNKEIFINNTKLERKKLGKIAGGTKDLEEKNLFVYIEYGENSSYLVFYDENTQSFENQTIKLKEDEFFILCDNRDDISCTDSRIIGIIKSIEILGIPFLIVFSNNLSRVNFQIYYWQYFPSLDEPAQSGSLPLGHQLSQ